MSFLLSFASAHQRHTSCFQGRGLIYRTKLGWPTAQRTRVSVSSFSDPESRSCEMSRNVQNWTSHRTGNRTCFQVYMSLRSNVCEQVSAVLPSESTGSFHGLLCALRQNLFFLDETEASHRVCTSVASSAVARVDGGSTEWITWRCTRRRFTGSPGVADAQRSSRTKPTRSNTHSKCTATRNNTLWSSLLWIGAFCVHPTPRKTYHSRLVDWISQKQTVYLNWIGNVRCQMWERRDREFEKIRQCLLSWKRFDQLCGMHSYCCAVIVKRHCLKCRYDKESSSLGFAHQRSCAILASFSPLSGDIKRCSWLSTVSKVERTGGVKKWSEIPVVFPRRKYSGELSYFTGFHWTFRDVWSRFSHCFGRAHIRSRRGLSHGSSVCSEEHAVSRNQHWTTDSPCIISACWNEGPSPCRFDLRLQAAVYGRFPVVSTPVGNAALCATLLLLVRQEIQQDEQLQATSGELSQTSQNSVSLRVVR